MNTFDKKLQTFNLIESRVKADDNLFSINSVEDVPKSTAYHFKEQPPMSFYPLKKKSGEDTLVRSMYQMDPTYKDITRIVQTHASSMVSLGASLSLL